MHSRLATLAVRTWQGTEAHSRVYQLALIDPGAGHRLQDDKMPLTNDPQDQSFEHSDTLTSTDSAISIQDSLASGIFTLGDVRRDLPERNRRATSSSYDLLADRSQGQAPATHRKTV